MTLIEPETPETLLIQKENRAELYSAIESLAYAEIVKHYLQCRNYAVVGRKFGYSRAGIQQIYLKAKMLIIKRLKEKTK